MVWGIRRFIAAISPLLADRVAIRGDIGVDEVASLIADAITLPSDTKHSGAVLAQIIENFQTTKLYAGEASYKGCQYRFLQIQAVNEEYTGILVQAHADLSSDELLESHPEIDEFLSNEEKRLLAKFGIPEDAYLIPDEPEHEDNLGWWMDTIGEWASGTLSREASHELLVGLDDHLDLDYLYILLGIPNFSVSRDQRPLLYEAVIALGSSFLDETNAIEKVCRDLRALDRDDPA